MFKRRNEKGEGGMGFLSQIIEHSLSNKADSVRGKNKWIPLGCAAIPVLCGTVYEMARVLDFNAIGAYINAFVKLIK